MSILLRRRTQPEPRLTLVLGLWMAASTLGTLMSVAALHEVARNWLALNQSESRYRELLGTILVGNLFQQVSRLVMEGLCWAAGIVAYVSPPELRSTGVGTRITSWILVAFRIMLTANSTIEYVSNRRRRREMTRAQRD